MNHIDDSKYWEARTRQEMAIVDKQRARIEALEAALRAVVNAVPCRICGQKGFTPSREDCDHTVLERAAALASEQDK